MENVLNQPYISTGAFAKEVGKHRNLISTLAKAGIIKALMIGKVYMIPAAEVEKFKQGKWASKRVRRTNTENKKTSSTDEGKNSCGESTTEAPQKQAESEVSHEQSHALL